MTRNEVARSVAPPKESLWLAAERNNEALPRVYESGADIY